MTFPNFRFGGRRDKPRLIVGGVLSSGPYMGSVALVPLLDLSSTCFLVRSCSLEMSSSGVRSALTASSPSEASSGFQWPLPVFCFESESCLCLS
jgi:hypothetical protein